MYLFILLIYFIHIYIYIYFPLCLFAVFTFLYIYIYLWLIVTKASFAPNIRPERRLVRRLLNNELERTWKEIIEA